MGSMGSVVLVTDSSACLPASRAEGPGLRVVPIVIHLASGDVRSDWAMAPARIYQALARDEAVKSSAPSAVEYLEAIEETGAQDVMVVTPAAELTVMYRNACLAADLSMVRTKVMDSRTAAAGHGLVVEAAHAAARTGASLEEVERAAADASRRVELVAALDGLEYVRRSGRVPSVALGFAEHLGVRPVFRLHQGAIERLGVPRSEPAALRRIAREAHVRGLASATRRVVFHAGCPGRAEALVEAIGGADLVAEFSPAMGIHTGPGVVGVTWLRA
jgi:DegV family protein with EDD domain